MVRKIIFALSLFVYASVTQAYMLLPIDEVYDGDTIKTHVSEGRMPAPLNKFSIRINGIDTPENPAKSYPETGKLGRAGCVREAELALAAKAFVQAMTVGNSKMKVDNFKWGKYGGRVVGDVKIGGVDVKQALIDAGLAVPYDGGTKTHDWCATQ